MKTAFGVSWNDSKKGKLAAACLALLLLLSVVPPAERDDVARTMDSMVSVIVRETTGADAVAERTVRRLGGDVDRRIDIIDGFSALIPRSALSTIRSLPSVHSVTPNRKVHLLSMDDDTSGELGSMTDVNTLVGSEAYWERGYTGQGVDVALIDSGVVPVEGLDAPGKVMHGPDLSLESQDPNIHHLDTFGHGTHLAGIIAGDDGDSEGSFSGVAPDAGILSVKVANAQGATDVSQVLAAIDWVVQHRNDNGLNVRVINLSFGTDGTQSYLLDPLTYAAEVAWHKGIVVVVAAGNSQFGDNSLNNPAYDPYVIAVGANDPGTKLKSKGDDVIPSWSARGDGTRNPDFVAPGRSVVSLRDPGSHIDLLHPEGRLGERFFKGSGTSQSAAVVSGAVALLLSERPEATPDQVKWLLAKTATNLPNTDAVAQGAGQIDLRKVVSTKTSEVSQDFPRATGVGSLDAARGGSRLVDFEGVPIEGEVDIFGNSWSGNSWSGNSWSGNSWSGGSWNGNSWSGNSWSGNSWSGNSWSGNSWSGNSWSGVGWSGNSWSGNSWSGNSWSGNSWSGNSWS
ncbi:MAG: S8 family serine peptidase [Actinomycetota bacterium]